MNYNVLKPSILQRFCKHYVKISESILQINSTQIRRSSISTDITNTIKAIDKRNDDSTELDSALQIEASMFENSTLRHKPAIASEVLQRNKFRRNITPKAKPATSTMTKPKVMPVQQKELKIVDDSELGIQFTRLNVKSPIISELMTTVRSKKQRGKNSQIVIEGRRLIQDALRCGLSMRTLLFSDRQQMLQLKDDLMKTQQSQAINIFEIAYHDLKVWSTLTTPPGLLAIFDKPTAKEQDFKMLRSECAAMPITVVCDNIREPNNLGSIIRTCAAIPCQQIITTRGCCDAWESKALRGGCGGHFRLPIRENINWRDVPLLITPEAADDCCVFIAENNLKNLPSNSTAINYDDLQRTGTHNVVIIGGETHGISNEAYNFLKLVGDNGKCLNIPVAQGADSLNVVSALTLILYELRKRLNNLV